MTRDSYHENISSARHFKSLLEQEIITTDHNFRPCTSAWKLTIKKHMGWNLLQCTIIRFQHSWNYSLLYTMTNSVTWFQVGYHIVVTAQGLFPLKAVINTNIRCEVNITWKYCKPETNKLMKKSVFHWKSESNLLNTTRTKEGSIIHCQLHVPEWAVMYDIINRKPTIPMP